MVKIKENKIRKKIKNKFEGNKLILFLLSIYIVNHFDWILIWKHNFTSGSRNADVADTWTWLNQGTIYGSEARPFRSLSLHNRSRLLFDSLVTLVLSLGFLVKPLFGCWENQSLTKKIQKNGRKMKYWVLLADGRAQLAS